MSVIVYALFAYCLTALISFAVIGIVTLTNKCLSRPAKEEGENDD